MQIDNTTEVRVDDLKSYAFLWYEKNAARIRSLLDGVNAAREQHGPNDDTS